MSDDQVYGVQLDLLTQNYNKKLQDVVNTTQTQAKLIEQKAKVNFNYDFKGQSPLSIQKQQILESQNMLRYILNNLEFGKIDITEAENSFNEILKKINFVNEEFSKVTNKKFSVSINAEKFELLQKANIDTQLLNKYVQVISHNLDKSGDSANKLADGLSNTSNEAKKLDENTDNASKNTSKLGQNFETAMNKGYNSTKRVLLSMFGIQSVWSLISRASSNAMSNNDELNSKVNVLNSALGNIMLPVVQRIVNYAEYGVIFVSKVIQFFTGFNALANLTTSNLKNATNQAKQLTKTLAGFDEITNINQSSNGSLAGGIKNDLQALDDFYKKIDEVENWMKNSGIYDFLKNIKAVLTPLWDNILKPMIDYAAQHPEVFTTLFSIFLGTKLASGIGNIIGSGNTGLTGMHGLVSKLAGIGVITIGFIVTSVYNELKQIDDECDSIRNNSYQAKKNWLNSNPALKDIYDTMNVNNTAAIDGLEKVEKLTSGINGWWDKIFHLSDNYLENSEQVVSDSLLYYDKLKEIYETGKLNNDEQITLIGYLDRQADVNDKIIEKLKQEGKDTTELEKINKNYRDLTDEIYDNLVDQGLAVDDINGKLEAMGVSYRHSAGDIDEIRDKLRGIAKEKYTCKMDFEMQDKTDYSNFATKAAQGIGGIFNKIGGSIKNLATGTLNSVLKSIGSYDVGTNYIPNDQLAMVHKGEMIVPAKYNPATSGINGGHDEAIISAIYELKEALEEKDMTVNISEDTIGQASSNYKNRRSRQLGREIN